MLLYSQMLISVFLTAGALIAVILSVDALLRATSADLDEEDDDLFAWADVFQNPGKDLEPK